MLDKVVRSCEQLIMKEEAEPHPAPSPQQEAAALGDLQGAAAALSEL